MEMAQCVEGLEGKVREVFNGAKSDRQDIISLRPPMTKYGARLLFRLQWAANDRYTDKLYVFYQHFLATEVIFV